MQRKDKGPIILDGEIKTFLNKVIALLEISEKDRDDLIL